PGVPLTLELQYTPPACATDSYLDLGLDDEVFQVVALRSAQQAITETRKVFIPASRLRSRAQLQFGFRFALKDDAGCRAQAGVAKAAVSPDSTLDFSGFPHYTRMPNLEHFAAAGFPFTRFADLSQTVVVLPDRPVAGDIEAMLGILARMGEATGYPATRVRIATPKDEAALGDADLLLIGASPQQVLLDKWAASFPVAVGRHARQAGPVTFEGAGPLAAVYGFESPLTSGRSVVAITALAPDQMLRVLDALDRKEMREEVRGSAAFVFPNKVQSVAVGRTYSVGFLPPWTGAGYWLSEHPVVPGLLAAVALLAAAYAAWRVQRKAVAWRVRSRA
ncbi:MAG: cellulose biosynthesis cyclic di-GMP-binding regulatory protein BcsB, partial [Usitatibacter sp.]